LALACGGIGLATLAAYWPALGDALIWNDADYVTKPALRSLHGLWRIWFEVGATEQYYPVLHSAFWVEYHLWGGAPAGYHLANIVLHAGAACLFALVLRRLAIPGAWLAACLFALHPVCVESVAWISEQKNTLSTVFYLLSALTYLRWRESRPRLYFLALFLFVLALLSKSVTATLPAALLVILWWRRGRLDWRPDVAPLLPWFATGASVGLFTAWVERSYIGAQGPAFALDPAQRCLVAGRAIWFYLGKLLWPSNLTFIYPRWAPDPANWKQDLFPLGAGAVLAAFWLLRRRCRSPLAVSLFFVGSLFPTLGFFNVYAFVFSYAADHWQYLASLGVFAAAGAGWGEWASRRGGSLRLPLVAATALLCGLGALTWRQTGMYRDVETLYRTTLARNPDAWLAQTNLGGILAGSGRPAEAIDHYRAALRLVPSYPEIHCNLADAMVKMGRIPEAVAEYKAAIRLNPAYFPAQLNLANTLVGAGRAAEAIPHYEQVLRLQPGNADWELDLGVALYREGRFQEAAGQDAAALQLRENFPEAHYNLGNALSEMGRLPDAIGQYRRALVQRPNYPDAEYGLANALGNAGRIDEAIVQYRAALRDRPDFPEAHANLGLALASGGRLAEGLEELAEAVRSRPRYAEAHAYFGYALARAGRPAEAVDEYREALRLNPDEPDVHYQLALALRALGRATEAAGEFDAARRAGAGAGP
jgi:tetratricopeptide (TPR) repeat protein